MNLSSLPLMVLVALQKQQSATPGCDGLVCCVSLCITLYYVVLLSITQLHMHRCTGWRWWSAPNGVRESDHRAGKGRGRVHNFDHCCCCHLWFQEILKDEYFIGLKL